jgi:group II intron reverse transcriptase/maturase
VVQRALVLLLEPIYEQVFLPCSYGFRPGRSAMECAAEAAEGMFRRRHVLEADIESFFDRVEHRKLTGMLREQIVDPRILDLIGRFLESGFLEFRKPWQPTKEGTPQGGPLSPLLANIYLHYALDRRFASAVSRGGHTQLYRYCDDFIVVSDHPGRLRSARRALDVWMKEAGLNLKESKTRGIDMSSHCRSRNSHLDFLGYRFHLRAFRDNPKRFWIARQPSEKARQGFRQRLKERLHPGLALQQAHDRLAETWRGWSGYFRYGNANRVLYREVHTVRRAVFHYLRKKFRSQRRPVPWRDLVPLAEMIWTGIRPPRVIPMPLRQRA